MINRDSQASYDEESNRIEEPLIVTIQETLAKQQQTMPPKDSNSDQELNKKPAQLQLPQEKEKGSKERLMSLDVYRGLTVLGMILADQTYEIDGAVWWLIHPKWNGLSCADLVFPAFLFIMGMAIPLAVSKTRPIKTKNIIRVFALFGIGLLLNFIQKLDFQNLRILGILQRLSLCYGINLFIHWFTNYGTNITRRRIAGFTMVGFVVLYITLMLSWFDESIGCYREHNLDPYCNFAGYVDRAVFTEAHILEKTDPEGLISTITASFTTYVGYLFGLMVLKMRKEPERIVRYWLTLAFICLLFVYPCSLIMSSNKRLYTITFVFITLSTCATVLSLFIVLVDILPKRYPNAKATVQKIVQPFNWLGLNPLAVFILLQLTGDVLDNWIEFDGGRTPFTAFYDVAFSWMGAYMGTLVYTCFYGVILTLAGGLLFKYKIFLRL